MKYNLDHNNLKLKKVDYFFSVFLSGVNYFVHATSVSYAYVHIHRSENQILVTREVFSPVTCIHYRGFMQRPK